MRLIIQPPAWIEKISRMHLFAEGWNKLRGTILANQEKPVVTPQNAWLVSGWTT